ncbi:MAG: peptidylprolyl isomerase [Acidobacteria bacterium]|nr:peptidylprolyl isomerase [Acidobacteriota bacterium]
MRYLLSIGMGALFLATALVHAGGGAAEGSHPPAQAVDPVIARVNGTTILESQVEERVRSTLSRASRSAAEIPAERVGALRRQLLENLVDEELLYQTSLKEKIEVPEKAVDEQVQTLEGRFASGQEFSDSLQQEGMSLASIKERIRRNLAVEALVKQKINSNVVVSESEITGYYQKNRERFRRPEAAHTLEIVAQLDPSDDSQERAAARQAMEAVLKEAKGGKDFAMLVREFSQGSSAAHGGDLGWLTRNGSKPLLAQAALKLKPGELSDILETPTGLHILKVLEKRPAEDVSLEEARSQIESLLREEKELSGLKDYITILKSGAKIEILTPTP